MKTCLWAALAASVMGLGACKTEHTIRIEPIEVKPMTMNINIRVQRELDNFFDFEKQMPATTTQPAVAPQPQQGVTQ